MFNYVKFSYKTNNLLCLIAESIFVSGRVIRPISGIEPITSKFSRNTFIGFFLLILMFRTYFRNIANELLDTLKIIAEHENGIYLVVVYATIVW